MAITSVVRRWCSVFLVVLVCAAGCGGGGGDPTPKPTKPGRMPPVSTDPVPPPK